MTLMCCKNSASTLHSWQNMLEMLRQPPEVTGWQLVSSMKSELSSDLPHTHQTVAVYNKSCRQGHVGVLTTNSMLTADMPSATEGLVVISAPVSLTCRVFALAASSASTKGTGTQLRLQGSTAASAQQPAFAINTNTPSTFIQRPPTADEMAQWRAAIAAHQQWSLAAPLLQQYFHLHGFGITSRNSALRCDAASHMRLSQHSLGFHAL